VETGPVAQLRVEADGALEGVELRDGTVVPLDVLFLKPAQHLPPLIQALGLALDEAGYVRTSPQGETSLPGLFAVGDLTTPLQAAMVAAYQGAVVGWTLVHELNLQVAASLR
jgi:thioredoxin reductase